MQIKIGNNEEHLKKSLHQWREYKVKEKSIERELWAKQR